jgi:hypothetical protein
MQPRTRPCPRCGDTAKQRFCGYQICLGVVAEIWNCDSTTCEHGGHSYEVARDGQEYEVALQESALRKRADGTA